MGNVSKLFCQIGGRGRGLSFKLFVKKTITNVGVVLIFCFLNFASILISFGACSLQCIGDDLIPLALYMNIGVDLFFRCFSLDFICC